MEFLPAVIEAEYRGGYLIKLTFNDGVEETIDFAQWLDGPVFEPLRMPVISRDSSSMVERSRGPMEPTSPQRRSMSWRSHVRRLKNGVLTLIQHSEALALEVSCSHDELTVVLDDGRTVSVPLAWFPRLLHASARQRKEWELIGGGIGVHWEAIDEDISVASLLRPEKFIRVKEI